jgi:hypothetical protein
MLRFLPQRCSIPAAASGIVPVAFTRTSVTVHNQATSVHPVVLTETARWEETACKQGEAFDRRCEPHSNVSRAAGFRLSRSQDELK